MFTIHNNFYVIVLNTNIASQLYKITVRFHQAVKVFGI